VIVLEARERIGGRCWTRRIPGIEAPVELGAEFIHGEARETRKLLRAARVAAIESVREQRHLRDGCLQPMNAFEEAARAVRGASLDEDVSFETFLAARRIPHETKTFARMMVQGFDAADPRTVSARSIIEEWGEGSLGASQPRPQGGYGPLLEAWATKIVRRKTRLLLPAVVKAVEWRRGAVTVRGHLANAPFSLKARRAVVTLPLGVLQSGVVRFSPALKSKQHALASLASGPVIRVAMRFHDEFWARRAPGVAFFHVPHSAFPTFWTPLPMRVPLLTAWAGGPKAQRLTGRSSAALLRAALDSVRAVFGKATAEPEAVLLQDWAQDPYSRGGYSYVLVGGEGAREELAAPLQDTLYFAGEATDADEAGTVAGALRSGARAARQIRNR
jgi:monoamine oxidase